MKESKIQSEIRIALNKGTVRAWRNNIAKLLVRGQWVNFGIPGKGGSDLIGFKTITITPDLVGKKIAQFLAIEVKSDSGKVKPDQIQFIDFIIQSGGVAGVARSVDDALKITQSNEP